MSSPSDVVSFVGDKRGASMPDEGARRRNGAQPRPPALWTGREVYDGQEPGDGPWGAYPKGFLRVACRGLHCRPSEVLHMCSGGVRGGRARVDLRREASPDVVADARHLPFADETFRGVMIDPPYSVEYAEHLYGTGYPRPKHLLEEASRVLVPGGRVGILHFIVPMVPIAAGLRLEHVMGVTTGAGYRIRAWSVFRKADQGLPLGVQGIEPRNADTPTAQDPDSSRDSRSDPDE